VISSGPLDIGLPTIRSSSLGGTPIFYMGGKWEIIIEREDKYFANCKERGHRAIDKQSS